jgi:hypothetical protein
MTRATMRALLRRQIQEASADQWTDADLNEALNHGLRLIQKEIIKLDAVAFAYMYVRDIEANVDAYPLPTSFIYEHSIEILNSTTGEYDRISKIDYVEKKGSNAPGSGDSFRYTIIGRYVMLTPKPAVAVTDGLRLFYMPVLTMAADTDTPEVDDVFHPTIVAAAKILLLEDTAEAGESTRKLMMESLVDLPMYRKPGAPEHVTVEGIVDKIGGY